MYFTAINVFLFFPDSSSGCTQCQMCPGGTEALQTAAKDCSPCRPGKLEYLKWLSLSHLCECLLWLAIEKDKNCFPSQWCVIFEQVCTRPPIRICVKSAAVVIFRSTGARKAVISAQRITTALWVHHTLSDEIHACAFKRYLATEHVFLSESWREPHSVSEWCLLSRGQLGSGLLHGDFLPQSRGHLWTGSCHYCFVSYWRRGWVILTTIVWAKWFIYFLCLVL